MSLLRRQFLPLLATTSIHAMNSSESAETAPAPLKAVQSFEFDGAARSRHRVARSRAPG